MSRDEQVAAQDRIFRVPVGQPIPEGYRFKQLLGQETGLAFGAAANFTADVVLAEQRQEARSAAQTCGQRDVTGWYACGKPKGHDGRPHVAVLYGGSIVLEWEAPRV